MTASFRSIALVCALVATTKADGQVFTQPRNDQEAIERYFEGLRQRRLFSLAETVCLRRLSERALDPAIRARYAVELSRTFSEHARYVAAFDEQTELLEQARESVLKLIRRGMDHPQQVLLEAQAQFVTAREVELHRWRFELQPFDTAPRDRAMLLSTRLVADFEQLDEKLSHELRVLNRKTPPGGLTTFQLRGLQRVLRHRLSAVLLDRAKMLERRSPDRAEALVKADSAFRRLASGGVLDDLAWRSRLGLVETIRLRGETTIAQKLLNGMLNDQPAPQVLDEIVAEQAEILITEKKLNDAADLLRQHRLERRGLNGRLSYLNAAVLLQLWKIAREKDELKLADEVLQEASTSVARAQVEADGYWAARARQLLASANSTKDYGAVAGALVQQAQSLFGAGKASEAAVAFEQAFAAARQEGRTEAAVEISYTAGSVLLKLDRFDEAAAFFQQAQTLQPDGPRAAHANLLQAWCKGRVYQQQPTSAHREAYAAALQQHREGFPDTSTFGDATWMLAGLEERRGQTVQALKLFAQVPNGHAHAAESRVAVARCAESILEKLKRADQPRAEWEAALVRQLDIFVQPVLAQPTMLTGPQAELLLRTGRLHLQLETPDYETADQLLLHIQANAKPGEDVEPGALDQVVWVETVNAAAGLRIVALVGKGDVDAARRELEQIASQGVNSLCDVLDGLTTAATRLDEQSRWSIGQLQLRTVELAKIDEGKLPETDRRRFRHSLAGAYELAGLPARAAAILTAFLKANPDDHQLRKRLAELLLHSDQPTDLRTAREHFRKLEAVERAGSPAWLRTRLQVIRASIALKETDEAKKLLKVTRLLHKNLGGPALKSEYDAVEASLN